MVRYNSLLYIHCITFVSLTRVTLFECIKHNGPRFKPLKIYLLYYQVSDMFTEGHAGAIRYDLHVLSSLSPLVSDITLSHCVSGCIV